MRRLLLPVFVLVFLAAGAPAAAGGGGCHTPGLTDATTSRVLMMRACFAPTVARVAPGDVLTFENVDPMDHRIDAPGGWAIKPELGQHDAVAFRFAKAGIYPYACFLHPLMSGVVVVGDGVSEGGSDLGVTQVKAVATSVEPAASVPDGAAVPDVAPAAAAAGSADIRADGNVAGVDGSGVLPAALAVGVVALSGVALVRLRRRRAA